MEDPFEASMDLHEIRRSWRSLISEPRFVLRHAWIWEAVKADGAFVGIAKNIRCLEQQYGVMTTSRYHLNSCCVHSLYNDSIVDVAVHDHELLGREYYHIVGTCHGLICFRTDDSLYLWNPVLKLHVRLPSSDLETRQGDHVTYGFGYDHCNGDFKVVTLLQPRHEIKKTEAIVYSVKFRHWMRRSTRECCFPSGVVLEKSKPGIHIKGTLNWASAHSSTIVSYDLTNDTFRELSRPVCCTKGCFTLTLGEYRGCLSMVCYCNGSNADVWVTKEFGEGESWMKLVSIPGLTEYIRPLWISTERECEVLLEFRSGLALYNRNNGAFTYPLASKLTSCCNSVVYVKTLVSPNLS
ncbi:PREDICTED: F-box/kelch-repeat protein At3g23880 isoform X2 [Tarenaya hassleriana]|uniref:F-box/kelch-repeat protein At3g23880 isoform X2 n=1 Tax=Tarenaya hassleriana TaxID=28532 RepID=UPI00053CA2E6|nr:PREDICTED: F-box/kelch-repeat protein At3g23880 isoform X2 [Tarenaya hassleriana]